MSDAANNQNSTMYRTAGAYRHAGAAVLPSEETDGADSLMSTTGSVSGGYSKTPRGAGGMPETASMTIRRVKADYTKNLEEAQARSSAMERYKSLLKNTPSPVKKAPEQPAQLMVPQAPLDLEDDEEDDLDDCSVSAETEPSQLRSMSRRTGGRRSATGGPAAGEVREVPVLWHQPPAATAVAAAEPAPAAAAPAAAVEEPAPVAPVMVRKQRPVARAAPAAVAPAAVAAAAPAPAVPALSAHEAEAPHVPAATAAAREASKEAPVNEEEEEEEEELEVIPIAPMRSNPARDAIKPDYNPIFSHPRGSCGTPRGTPRGTRASQPRASVASTAESSSATEGNATVNGEDTASTPADATTAHTKKQKKVPREGLKVSGGSAKAFWVRPSSALYETTASIAAKRSEKTEVAPSPCSARRGGPAAASNSARPSTYGRTGSTYVRSGSTYVRSASTTLISRPTCSSAQRQSGSTINSPRVSQAPPSPRGHPTARVVKTRAASSSTRTSSCNAAPKPRPQPQAAAPMQRQASTSNFTRRHSSTMELSSNAVVHKTAEGGPIGTARVSGRQDDSFRRHCERLAARKSTEGPAAAVASHQHQPTPAPAPLKRKASTRSSLQTATETSSSAPTAGVAKVRRCTSSGKPIEAGKVKATKKPSPQKQQQAAAPSAASQSPEVRNATGAATHAMPTGTAYDQTPRLSGTISKKLLFDMHGEGREDGEGEDEEPCPLPVAPRASERPPMPVNAALVGTPLPLPPRKSAPRDETEDDLVGRSPSKSLRREGDSSPARPEPNEADRRAATAKAALDAARQAYQSRHRTAVAAATSAATTTTPATPRTSAQLARLTVPCFYCAEQQSVATYRVHLELCASKTLSLLQDRHIAPSAYEAALTHVQQLEPLTQASSSEERAAYTTAAFQCCRAMLVPCGKCACPVRVHDAREHEMLCGRSYYTNSKAAVRVKEAVARIEEGASE